MSPRPRRWGRRLAALALLVLAPAAIALGVASATLGHDPLEMVQALLQRTPGEFIRYAKQRLIGHPRLEAVALPVLHAVQRQVEREVPPWLPSLGKGQQPQGLEPLRYGQDGQPLPAAPAAGPVAGAAGDEVLLHSAADIAAAVDRARPGQRLLILPGTYRISRLLQTRTAGTALAPIVLAAARPGEVTLEFETMEGITVYHPYWVFENLTLRGACANHFICEHAFHVVGAARATVLRNNRIEDFNAHVKVNGFRGQWPDDGLIQFNTIVNTTAREMYRPAAPIDIVAASGWRVADNVVANFVKTQGNRGSTGIFMKGAGERGRIERNLVVCTPTDISRPGNRVGISFGGGGTGLPYCRDRRCDAEHRDGLMANNVIAHCNDFGIDVLRSTGTVVAFNTLINTAGIDVRVAPSQAHVHANVLDGRIRARSGGRLSEQDNVVGSLHEGADTLFLQPPASVAPRAVAAGAVPMPGDDFCGLPREAGRVVPGAVTRGLPCPQADGAPPARTALQ
ncbi:right-handed parallel beta-helix repeat-containing protein [Azohydromonas aeria]|uniref:right-handed parallel beta-helix repeat-containing protein n=1 Tax=Azohydromonas aeria TaxID=2590212 RepID=UPI0012F808B6|nr:right-handed parallel beta-helix repeat-containing protein [Azohydromonas aeria]